MTLLPLTPRGFKTLDPFFDSFFTDAPAKNVNHSYSPLVNVTETPDQYELVFMVPGRKKEDFKIKVEQDILTISFEQKEQASDENRKELRKEFSLRSFERSFTLDETMDADSINARYDNGLLTITLPKKEEVKVIPKEIAVS